MCGLQYAGESENALASSPGFSLALRQWDSCLSASRKPGDEANTKVITYYAISLVRRH